MKKNNPIIFLISGQAESGKNTIAQIIEEKTNDSITISITKYLKDYVMLISEWDGNEETKPRQLLQKIGIDLIKNQLDNNFLINRTIQDITFLSYFKKVIIVTGIRLQDEIELIKNNLKNDAKIYSINIIRPNHVNKLTNEQNNHITETNLINYHNFDYIINNSSFEEAEKQVTNILKEVYYE